MVHILKLASIKLDPNMQKYYLFLTQLSGVVNYFAGVYEVWHRVFL